MSDAPVVFKRRPGQPRKLYADERTLQTVRGLGQIQATIPECAAVLNVSHMTFSAFLNKNPVVREVFEDGKASGRASLRRTQFRLAERNAAMAIFLGKNYLDQSDRQEFTGKDGGPLEVRTLADFYGALAARPPAETEPDA